MNIKIPTSWQEMTDWQQEEIIDILYHTEDFSQAVLGIIQTLLMKNDGFWQYLKMRKILRNFPLSAFVGAIDFIYQEPKIYQFPTIKKLKKPAERVGDISIKQFSICETLLYRWKKATGENKNLILKQLVACLYRLGDDFNEQDLPKIAKITDKISLKKAQRIAFIFSSVCNYIADAYPSIFIKKSDEKKEFSEKHTPFSKIITMMAADELRLLGNLKECQNTLVYDFLNSLLESKRIHEMRAKLLK